MTSENRIDFIGIGAPKSGSTWIGKCLEEHPQILMSSLKTRKEIHFFNIDDVWGDHKAGKLSYYKNGLDWYLDQFPDAKPGHIRGEFSVTYMADPVAYKRIHEAFPETKIIAVLRNPIKMIYSLYWFFYNSAIQKMPDTFLEALDNETLVEKGFYFKHLQKYFELFPKENIHIIFYDDIKNDPLVVLKKLYGFLGVDKKFVPQSFDKRINASYGIRNKFLKDAAYWTMQMIYKLNLEWLRVKIIENKNLFTIYSWINKVPAKYAPMSNEDKNKCIEIYKEDIKKLGKLTNRDLSSWMEEETTQLEENV